MNLINTFYVTLVMRQKLVRAFLSFGVVLRYFVLPWWKNDIIKKTRNYHVFIIPLCAFQCVFFISTWPAKFINSSKLMSMGVMFIRLKCNSLNCRGILWCRSLIWILFHLISGATREIGACLTRIVLRHKAMESRMKTLCSALLECMILPLQDKLEDWRKNVGVLDKEHAKEYKKVRWIR